MKINLKRKIIKVPLKLFYNKNAKRKVIMIFFGCYLNSINFELSMASLKRLTSNYSDVKDDAG
jgi:hypothetical protein